MSGSVNLREDTFSRHLPGVHSDTKRSERLEDTEDHSKSEPKRSAKSRVVRTLLEIFVGLIVAVSAVRIRMAIDLPSEVLPSFLLIIGLCLVTVAAGFVSGLVTMIAGGMLTWYYILSPGGSWEIDGRDGYSLLGFFSIASVILATSQLYRLSEIKRQRVALKLALQEADHQRLFAREMSHRLKNAMAIVQSIASQTFTHGNPEVGKFEGRLSALANAHNLLNEHVKEPTASIAEVVRTAIAPFDDKTGRFEVSGEPLALPDQQVVSLSIALHELCTNAVKYGALSAPEGWVSIEWAPHYKQLLLEWEEHDGPAITAPLTKGFGSRLLARAAMRASLKFEEDGLRCTIALTSRRSLID